MIFSRAEIRLKNLAKRGDLGPGELTQAEDSDPLTTKSTITTTRTRSPESKVSGCSLEHTPVARPADGVPSGYPR